MQPNQTENKPKRFWQILGICFILWSSISAFFIGSAYYESLKNRDVTEGRLQQVKLITLPNTPFFSTLWVRVQYEYIVNGQ